MKIVLAIIGLILAGLGSPRAFAQQQNAPAQPRSGAAAGASIDPVKEADIRKLLDLAGAADAAKKAIDNLEGAMRPLLMNSLPEGDYREKLIDLFIQKFRGKADVKMVVEMAVPIYDKYLTDDEIKGMIQFYTTPLGHKMSTVLPQIAMETQTQAMQWGQQMGQEAMQEVMAEHPELLKAAEDAAKAAQPAQR